MTESLKVSVKPFKGDLPKRTGPKTRVPTPFDELLSTMIGQAANSGDKTSEPFKAEAKFSDPKELRPIVNQLRSALQLHDTEKTWGLRTWVMEDGLVFQVAPRVVRQAA